MMLPETIFELTLYPSFYDTLGGDFLIFCC
nr:MAG TPA: hypothetical protein [Caudoviricetes sp.]